MKKTGKAAAIILSMMLIFTGCAASATGAATSDSSTVTTNTEESTAASKAEMFTDRDLSGEYDESEAAAIELNGTTATVHANSSSSAATSAAESVTIDGSTITISAEGVYVVSGTLSDGMIIVDADDTAKVQIVLDNASITSSTSAALYVKSADKVFVTTASGTQNTLANGGTFTAIDDNNIDGAVFAKDDITFNGSGSLTITSPAGHGVVGKDDVKFAGGTYTITASNHGVQGNDSVRVAEAEITITAGAKDGIHVADNDDEENGTASDSFFYMADGTVSITAGDDGIHADAQVIIEGGTITVTDSYEGIEGLTIDISGGKIDVTASDDGLNAAGGNSTSGSGAFGDDDWFGGGQGGFNDGGTDGSIVISGGETKIQAGGDGIDSNGSLEISGGYTVVEGPTVGDTSVLDYNSTGTITGGTFIGTGGSGMAQSFSSAENQGLIAVNVGNQSAGQTVTLTDASGNVIAEVTPELDYAVVYVSTPDVAQGSTYTLTAGTYSETIELTESIYSSIGGGMGGRMGGQMGGGPGSSDGQSGSGGPGGQDSSDGQSGFGGPGGGHHGSGGPGGFGGPGSSDQSSGDQSGYGGSGNSIQSGLGDSAVNG